MLVRDKQSLLSREPRIRITASRNMRRSEDEEEEEDRYLERKKEREREIEREIKGQFGLEKERQRGCIAYG